MRELCQERIDGMVEVRRDIGKCADGGRWSTD